MRQRCALCLVLAACALACSQPKPPGELVGAYHVAGALLENTCGQTALPAIDPLAFDVELRQDDAGRGIWLRDMPPARFGQLDAQGEFEFKMETSYPIDLSKQTADPYLEFDPEQLRDPEYYERSDQQRNTTCTLIVAERIAGTILRDTRGGERLEHDAGSSAADLSGKNEIAVRAAAGSRCEPVLSTHGGPFEALPCAARYELTGELAR